MSVNMTIGSLKPADLTEMYIAFLDSFSDYKVPFRLSKEQFVRKFVEKLKINFALSAGAFHNHTLAGFIFTAVNYYEGKLTAYNGGTGVRPSKRGQKLTFHMYNYLIPLFKARGIRQCVLEVLTENDRAIKAYREIGFRKTKHYKCFKLERNVPVRQSDVSLEISGVKSPDWNLYEDFSDQTPSFLDSPLMINDNLANETVIEAHAGHQCVGYAVFQPAFGRISQIGVAPEFRRRGIGANLIRYIQNTSKQKILTIINVDQRSAATIKFFERMGFINQLNQYEMVLTLD